MGHRSLIVAIGTIGFSSCGPLFPPPEPPTPPPEPAQDGGAEPEEPTIEPETGSECERACARMQRLGCPEGDPSPNGQRCRKWFCEASSSGILNMNAACLAKITDCSEVDGRCRE